MSKKSKTPELPKELEQFAAVGEALAKSPLLKEVGKTAEGALTNVVELGKGVSEVIAKNDTVKIASLVGAAAVILGALDDLNVPALTKAAKAEGEKETEAPGEPKESEETATKKEEKKEEGTTAEQLAAAKAAIEREKRAPKPYVLAELKHWDLSKDLDIKERRKQEPDALIGFYRSPTPDKEGKYWTMCSGSSRLNIEKCNKIAGGGKKLFIPFANSAQIEEFKQVMKSSAKPKKFKNFDLTYARPEDIIPQGNADKVEEFYLRTHANMLTGNMKEIVGALNKTGATLCDISTFGSTAMQHRAMGIKAYDENGKLGWFVIDPYRRYKGKYSSEPIPFEEYGKAKGGIRVKFAVPIDTSRPEEAVRQMLVG